MKINRFSPLGLVVSIVLLGAIVTIAVTACLELKSDARVCKLKSIQESLISAFQLSYNEHVVTYIDSEHWSSEQKSEYYLGHDGHIEFIYWDYPVVYDAETLRNLIYTENCIIEGAQVCHGDDDVFVSEFVIDSQNALKSSYILRVRIDGIVSNNCQIEINNIEQSPGFEIVSKPQVEIVTTGC